MSDEIVRVASPEDEEEVMRLLTLMHAESGMLMLDEARAREMFRRAFHRRGAVLGLIGPPGDIKAMIFLLISNFWYTSQYHLEELFNFVRPDCRKSNYARRMIAFAQTCADETKLPLVIGVLTNQRMEGKVRLYRRNLGYPKGAFFVYGSGWNNTAEESNEDFWKAPFPGKPPTIKPNHNGTTVIQ